MDVEAIRLRAEDSVELEGEVAMPAGATLGAVLCHPHPLHGGNMRSVVTGALFEGIAAAGMASLRFNFRGVEGSGGDHTGGDRERLDVDAALAELGDRLPETAAIGLCGWSFGADVALSVRHERHRGWLAVAPPLRWADALVETADDERPKRIVLGQHDQFRPPPEIEAAVEGWTATTTEVVGGADHYFIGRADRLVAIASDFLASLARTSGPRGDPGSQPR